MFSSPFAYFVFLSWSFFMGGLAVYVVIWKLAAFKHYCEKL